MRSENTLAAQPDGRGLRGLAKRAYLDWVFARCAAFLSIGAANRAYYLAHGVDSERLFAMPYAVDNEFFRRRSAAAAVAREKLRAEIELEPGRPIILFAGKLQRRKNPLVLVDAFRRLDRRRLRRPYLVVVGDGEQRAETERAAGAAGDLVARAASPSRFNRSTARTRTYGALCG